MSKKVNQIALESPRSSDQNQTVEKMLSHPTSAQNKS